MLFLENAYLKECKTTVVSIDESNIILKDNLFYAKSGGQPGDIGTLIKDKNEINIIDTIYDNEKKILHISENLKDIKVGDEIIAKINWNIRYQYMRMHSALHLLCSLIPYGVTGGQISIDKSRLDFNAENKIEKEKIEDEINRLVQKDFEINYQWVSNEYLDNNPELVRTMSVKPPKNNNKIRLVKIGNIDLQPCG